MMKNDMRPVRALFIFCPYRALVLVININPKALPLGYIIYGFQPEEIANLWAF
jgi:hypothetical protein